jgi:hypothetical protein
MCPVCHFRLFRPGAPSPWSTRILKDLRNPSQVEPRTCAVHPVFSFQMALANCPVPFANCPQKKIGAWEQASSLCADYRMEHTRRSGECHARSWTMEAVLEVSPRWKHGERVCALACWNPGKAAGEKRVPDGQHIIQGLAFAGLAQKRHVLVFRIPPSHLVCARVLHTRLPKYILALAHSQRENVPLSRVLLSERSVATDDFSLALVVAERPLQKQLPPLNRVRLD